MKYVITVSVDEGPDAGRGLDEEWNFDTRDPGWRSDLPSREFFVGLVEAFEIEELRKGRRG